MFTVDLQESKEYTYWRWYSCTWITWKFCEQIIQCSYGNIKLVILYMCLYAAPHLLLVISQTHIKLQHMWTARVSGYWMEVYMVQFKYDYNV